jgi:aminoglycoside phosphotransferase (APT) family kinase protein
MGLSRQTWVVDLDDRRVVLRLDHPGQVSACPASLHDEYELYRILGATDLPVARALWFEDDPSVLGARFYLREFVEGTPSPPGFDQAGPTGDDVRIEVSKEHARKLTLVHQLDWGALGLGHMLAVPDGPAECASTAVGRIRAAIAAVAEPLPLVEAIGQWLYESAPRHAPAVVLCKGSNGAMQEIWSGTEIVGLSDWELASLGDPASDWARCQGYVVDVPGRWDLQRLLDYYASVSGYEVDTDVVEYYRLVYAFEMILVGLHSGRAVMDGEAPDARMAYLASATVQSGIARLARSMGIG